MKVAQIIGFLFLAVAGFGQFAIDDLIGTWELSMVSKDKGMVDASALPQLKVVFEKNGKGNYGSNVPMTIKAEEAAKFIYEVIGNDVYIKQTNAKDIELTFSLLDHSSNKKYVEVYIGGDDEIKMALYKIK